MFKSRFGSRNLALIALFLFGIIGAAVAQNPIFVRVSEAGLADGSDWDNAASLITAINQVQSSGGGTIYMDKGTYPLAADLPTFDKTMDLTILGGFDVAGGTTTTAQRAAISYWTLNPTVIHGGGAFAMFSFTSAGFSNFTLDGLTLGSARKASGDGSVLYQPQTATYGELNLNRCTVINNVSANGNGAFAMSTMASRVTATDCAFLYNTASASGGVFFTDSTNLVFSNCEFSTNTATNGSATYFGGGAINMHGSFSGLPMTLTATTCAFNGNQGLYTSNNGQGGAIVAMKGTAASLAVTLSGCNFLANNRAAQGGAFHIVGATSVLASGCRFENNVANYNGGAARFENVPSALITGCTFKNNTANETGSNGGGAIFCYLATNLTVANSTFDTNLSQKHGGAIYHNAYNNVTYPATVNFDNCLFQLNKANANSGNGGAYGGIYVTTTIITNCTFTANTSSFDGGAVRLDCPFPNSALIRGCIFKSNSTVTAGHYGGAINSWKVALTVDRCWLEANTCQDGAGIYMASDLTAAQNAFSYLNISNTVFKANIGGGWGGAIARNCTNSPAYPFNVINCSFVSNRSTNNSLAGFYVDGINDSAMGDTVVANCLFEDQEVAYGSTASNRFNRLFSNCLFSKAGGRTKPGISNIVCNARIVNPVYADSLINADMTLPSNSPAVNAGAASVLGLAAPATDYAGAGRVAAVDIGAFENQAPGTPAPPTPRSRTGRVWYVSTAGAGGGTAWTTDESSIANALASAADGDQIWMKTGSYSFAENTITKILTIYGGFAGSEGSPAARAMDAVALRPANPTTITAAATSRVFTVMPDAIDFVVDGIDFTGGNPSSSGGGAIDSATSLAIARCYFRANNVTAGNYHALGGGAVRVAGSTGGWPILTVSNSLFLANTTSQANGRVWCGGGAVQVINATATFTDCIFDGNTATHTGALAANGGGAVGLFGSATSATLTRCLVQNQSSTGAGTRGGGAIYAYSIPGLNLDSCTFYKNTAQSYGGAVRMDTAYNSFVTANNCIFTTNSSTAQNAGALSLDGSMYAISNSQFKGNTALNGPGALDCYSNNSYTTAACSVANCVFEMNKVTAASQAGGAIRFSTVNFPVTVSNCQFLTNTTIYDAGAIRVDAMTVLGSLAFSDCYFLGNQAGTTNYGGVIHTNTGYNNWSFDNCTFLYNRAGGRGGAVSTYHPSTTTLTNCLFGYNVAGGSGGAINCRDGSASYLTISGTNTQFIGNSSTADAGGAVFCDVSGALPHNQTWTNCKFIQNKAQLRGGALVQDGDPGFFIMSGCEFTSNTSVTGEGGGIDIGSLTTFTMTNSVFQGNVSASVGSAFDLMQGANCGVNNITMTSCVIRNNKVTGNLYGGAVRINSNQAVAFNAVIDRVWFEGNEAWDGAAFWLNSGNATLHHIQFLNCVFARNVAREYGGAVRRSADAPLSFINCTFVNNIAQTAWVPVNAANPVRIYTDGIFVDNNAAMTRLLNCIFDGHEAAFTINLVGTASGGGMNGQAILSNNLFGKRARGLGCVNTCFFGQNIAPVLADPLLNADYTLQANSPAINAGADTLLGVVAPDNDYLLRARVNAVDIGAFEDPAGVNPLPPVPPAPVNPIVRVTLTGSPTADGSDWTVNATTLDNAIKIVDDGGQVWFQTGNYAVAGTTVSKNIRFVGGFAGTEVASSERVFDGSLLANPTTFTAPSVNVNRQMAFYPGLTSCSIDGINFFNGVATTDPGGSAILSYSALDLANCVFTSDAAKTTAWNYGGAVYVEAVNRPTTQMKVDNCRFLSCTAGKLSGQTTGGSGAMQLWRAPVTVTNTLCYFCLGAQDSGGITFSDKPYMNIPTLTSTFNNCVFDSNTGPWGAGLRPVYCSSDTSKLIVSNSTFSNNNSTQGGAICISNDTGIAVSNCAFISNMNSGIGGAAIYARDGTINRLDISGSSFTLNRSTVAGGCIYTANSTTNRVDLNVNNCYFYNNWATGNGGAIMRYSSTYPNGGYCTISNSTFTSNTSANETGAVKDDNASTTIIDNCTFTSNGCASYGSALGLALGNKTVTNCVFRGNYNNGTGGTRYGTIRMALSPNASTSCNGVIDRCWFEGNSVGLDAGCVYVQNDGSSVTISNTVMVNNTAFGVGGAIRKVNNTSLNVINCTLYGNRGGVWGGAYADGIINDDARSNCLVVNTLFDNHDLAFGSVPGLAQGQAINCLLGSTAHGYGMSNSISGALPVNCVTGVDAGLNNPAAFDFTLKNSSPAIGAGVASVPGIIAAPATDYALVTRSPLPDIGAFENPFRTSPDIPTPPAPRVGRLFYITPGAPRGLEDGATWTDACALDAAITSSGANDTMWLETGVYPRAAATTVTYPLAVAGGFATYPASEAALDLRARDADGFLANPTTITASGTDRAFEFTSQAITVTLDGLHFTNGYCASVGGGAVDVNGALTMSDCYFVGNRADLTPGSGQGGGALRVCAIQYTTETVSIVNTIFVSNCTTISCVNDGSGGGALLLDDLMTADLTSCSFAQNYTNYIGAVDSTAGGGALALFGGNTTATLTACVFINNNAFAPAAGAGGTGGGAIFVSGPKATFNNCTANFNRAGRWGGAIRSLGIVTALTFNDCVFNSNTAAYGATGSYSGGALSLDSPILTLNRCYLGWNLASVANSESGAMDIWNNPAPVNITQCTFDGNVAGLNGGAIRANVAQPVNITSSTFQYNRTTVATGGNGGGAIRHSGGAGVFTIRGCTFLGNQTAQEGGALGFNQNQAITHYVADTTFTNNRAVAGNGGAVREWGEAFTYDRCVFTGNSGASGGAVAAGGKTATFNQCDFINNTTPGGGGAIRTESYSATDHAILNATTCTFTGNTATGTGGGGGAIMRDASNPTADTGRWTLVNCVFTNNSTGFEGGAFRAVNYNRAPINSMTNCVFINNRSTGANGGGVARIYNEPWTFTSCTMMGNQATLAATGNGGVFAWTSPRGWEVYMDRCIMRQNTSALNGGAISMDNFFTSLTLVNCIVASNTAAAEGGGVRRSSNGRLFVVNTTFYGNRSNSANQSDAIYTDGVTTAAALCRVLNCVFDGQRKAFHGVNATCAWTSNSLRGVVGLNDIINAIQSAITQGDPAFADPNSSNFDLTAASANAINKGVTAWAPITAPTVDIVLRSRTYPVVNNTPDYGAYEAFAGVLSLSPIGVDFGSQLVGSVTTASFTLTNTGNAPLDLDPAKWTATGASFDVQTAPNILLQPSQTAQLVALFNPLTSGEFTGSLAYNDITVPNTTAPLVGATAPQVTAVVLASPNPTNAAAVNFQVGFSQIVENISVADFAPRVASGSIAPLSVTNVSVDRGTTVTVTVATGIGKGQLTLDVLGLADIAEPHYGALLANVPFTAGAAYDFDKTPPVAISLIPQDSGPTSASAVIYDLKFDKPVTGVAPGNFSVTVLAGSASGVPGAVAGAGTDWTVTLDSIVAAGFTGGVLRLELTDVAGIADTLGNPLAAGVIGGTVIADQVGPTFDPVVDVEPSSGSTIYSLTTVTLTFSEPAYYVTPGLLTVTTDGVTILPAVSVTNPSGANWAFVFDDVFGSGPITLNIAFNGASVLDAAGNASSSTAWSYEQNKSIIPVTIASVTVADGGLTSQSAIDFTATFMSPVANFTTSDLVLVNAIVTAFAGSGADYTFTIQPLAQGTVSAFIPMGVCTSAVPPTTRVNAASNLYNFTFDSVAPTPVGLVAAPAFSAVSTTVTIQFTASETLAGDPIVSVNGAPATLTIVAGGYYEYVYWVAPGDAEGPATIAVTMTDVAGNTTTTLNVTALTIDKTAPTAVITIASIDINSTAIVQFSEDVTGVTFGDFVLRRDGAVVAGLSGFTQVSPSLYTLIVPNVNPGSYELRLVAAGSGVADRAGLPMAVDAVVTWRISFAGSDVPKWSRY